MKVFNIKFSQTIAKIIAMMNNAGCKNKSGWLIKKHEITKIHSSLSILFIVGDSTGNW